MAPRQVPSAADAPLCSRISSFENLKPFFHVVLSFTEVKSDQRGKRPFAGADGNARIFAELGNNRALNKHVCREAAISMN
jgi:hypothetical protein